MQPIIEATTASTETTSDTRSKSINPLLRATIEDLPNELLTSIINNLDSPQPSASALYDEPSFDLTVSKVADLKAFSRVSKRWRQAVLPLLFRHAQFIVKEPTGHKTILDQELRPFTNFVARSQLCPNITTFTLIVYDKKVTSSSSTHRQAKDFSAVWKLLFEFIDPVELLLVAPAEALGTLTSCHVQLEDVWCFDCPCQYLRLQQLPKPLVLEPPLIENAVAVDRGAITKTNYDNRGQAATNLPTMNISEDLTGLAQGESQQDNPGSGSSSSRASLDQQSGKKHAESSLLFEARPWKRLLINEGSFIKMYATYEFWLRQAPSVRSHSNWQISY